MLSSGVRTPELLSCLIQHEVYKEHSIGKQSIFDISYQMITFYDTVFIRLYGLTQHSNLGKIYSVQVRCIENWSDSLSLSH